MKVFYLTAFIIIILLGFVAISREVPDSVIIIILIAAATFGYKFDQLCR